MTAVIWAVVALLALWRLDRFANRVLDLRDPEKVTDTTPPAIPEDLAAFAMLESEKIAQDDVLKVIRERFEQLRPGCTSDGEGWNRVRRAVGVAEATV